MSLAQSNYTATLFVAITIAAGLPGTLFAEENIAVTVNGKPISRLEISLAETEYAEFLGDLTGTARRYAVIKRLIDAQLLTDAAEDAGLNNGELFEALIKSAKRRISSGLYFQRKVLDTVTENDARLLYETQTKASKLEEETRVRHILVDSEARANELRSRITAGDEFAKLARQHSLDPGTNWNGGDVGYFVKGQMDERFEAAVAALPIGGLSRPIETSFGWHVILVENRRVRPAPTFSSIKEDIVGLLARRKADDLVFLLRSKGNIDIREPDIAKLFVADQNSNR